MTHREALETLGCAIRDGKLTITELLDRQVEAIRRIPADEEAMREALTAVEIQIAQEYLNHPCAPM